MKNFFIYLFTIVGAVLLLTLFFSKEPGKKTEMKNESSSKAPEMTIDTSKVYSADIATNLGNFTIEFFAKDAPNTVNNFITLAKKNFYDGTVFHRIIKGFMIQGGDPKGDGTGGPGYKFADESINREYKRGIVAMANSGPDTNGSQFFVMHEDYDLPKNYVIFGQVTNGLETIDKIANVKVEDNGMGEQSKPTEKITVSKITISEK